MTEIRPRISGTFHNPDGTDTQFQILADHNRQWGNDRETLAGTVDALASMGRAAREEGFFVVPERRTITATVEVTYDDIGENLSGDDLADAIRDAVFTTVREQTDIDPIVISVSGAQHHATPPRCGEWDSHNSRVCDQPVEDGHCAEHGEVGPDQ